MIFLAFYASLIAKTLKNSPRISRVKIMHTKYASFLCIIKYICYVESNLFSLILLVVEQELLLKPGDLPGVESSLPKRKQPKASLFMLNTLHDFFCFSIFSLFDAIKHCRERWRRWRWRMSIYQNKTMKKCVTKTISIRGS